MFLENLNLENFKNYESCSFKFSPKLNFIFGENGNGKTNILEAISMLCYTKSFLLNAEADCVKYGENTFNVMGEFNNRIGIRSKVRLTFGKDESEKNLYHGNEKINRMNDFIGNFPLIVLSPQDLKLTTGTPQDRRRNFDLLISQVSRVYLDDLKNYNRVIRQKNSLLKDNLITRKYSHDELKNLIHGWNEELISFGIKILFRRLDFIEEFRDYLLQCFFQIVGDKYVPVISYHSDILGEFTKGTINVDSIKGKFSSALLEKLDAEIKRGISLAGPHRDNYIFRMEKDGRLFDMKTFASQGEHKTFVVSLKLSEYGYIKENLHNANTGEPILLLDDIFSELDKSRINRIGSLITGYNQVFLTTTDYDFLKLLKNNFNEITSYQITNGTAAIVN
jgi:DNA replication and repair protein RecF